LITNGNIEQLPFHYWSDWHRCQHHQHSGNIMVGDCLFSDNRFRFSFIAFIYMIQKLPPEINSIYAYINPIIAVLLGAIIFGKSSQ
jgi:EamA domain-containing membrane protein RarD